MTIKTSISLTELKLPRSEKELEEAELSALRALLQTRQAGSFVEVDKGRARTRRMLHAKSSG